MKTLYPLIILLLLTSCKNDMKTKLVFSRSKKTVSAQSIDERLKDYFSSKEIEPAIVINNTDDHQTEIVLPDHRIKWINSEEETKIKIDNDLFTLKNQLTLNNVKGHSSDEVDFANNWDQVKLYKVNGREIIGIRMRFHPCTGIGCSVDYYLLYDAKTKNKNFFGTFRTNRELNLYQIGNDPQPDFVSGNYTGESDGVAQTISNTYILYSMDENGRFHEQKDEQQQPYFIKRIFASEEFQEFNDSFDQHWIEPIK